MFRRQSDLLQDLPWEVFQALTGCGPIYRDVLQGPFEIVGAPLENADPAQHAIFKVTNQGDQNVAAAHFGGPVNVNGSVNISGNITINGQYSGLDTTVTLHYVECENGWLTATPYTLTFKKGVLTTAVQGNPVALTSCLPPFVRGTLGGTLSQGGSAPLTTGDNEEYTVWDDFLEAGYQIDNGTKVGACLDWEDGKYYVTVIQGCPTEVD